MRDLFGSILCISLEKKIDMDEVLSYPLTPVPLSLCNVDETMLTTPKSALMKHLEERIISVAPLTIDAQIIDAAFFLHLYTDLPAKFGGVARFLLRKILKREGQIIHFVSDKWITPSIKDSERDSRNAVVENFNITGPQQSRPGNWMSALRNGSFKTALIQLLVDNWKDDDYASLFEGKILYVNSDNKCYSFKSVLGKVVRTEEFNLYSDHEEADSRMFHHIQSLPKPSNVVVRSNDTDVLVIAIGCRSKIDTELKIWLEAGVQGKNNLRFISVDQICSNLGETFCHALPAYFAFIGCDYSAAFSRKGKVTPFKKLETDIPSQIAFGRLADASLAELAEIFPQIEKYTCLIYGKKTTDRINDVRTDIFMDKYKPKREDDKISCVKKLDGSMLPPCSRVLWQKVKRTCYIAHLWMSSVTPCQPHLEPTVYGWKLEGNCYRIDWYEGEASPRALEVVCEDSADSEQEVMVESDVEDKEEELGETDEEDEDHESHCDDSDIE